MKHFYFEEAKGVVKLSRPIELRTVRVTPKDNLIKVSHLRSERDRTSSQIIAGLLDRNIQSQLGIYFEETIFTRGIFRKKLRIIMSCKITVWQEKGVRGFFKFNFFGKRRSLIESFFMPQVKNS